MINKPANWDEFEENEVVSNDGISVGAYPVQIKKVTNVPENQYFKLEIDIVKDKKFANYFGQLKERLGLEEWPNQGIYYASYKETATKFFKAFITAVQKSNQGYVWNWDESTLLGKFFVANYGEEEYIDNEGNVKTSIKIREVRSIEAWQKGDVKPLTIKKLKVKPSTDTNVDPFANIGSVNISDADLPF